MPKKQPQQDRSREKLQRILDGTCRLLVKNCFSTLTTNHIAQEAGVTVGSIYQFFPNKDAILFELATSWFQDINEKTGSLIDASMAKSSSAKEVIRELFEYVSLEYQSPLQGAENELTRALHSNDELTLLDRENRDRQALYLQTIFKHYGTAKKGKDLLSFCHFMHDVVLSCSYQVANASGKEQKRLLSWSLSVMDSLSEQGMQASS